MVFSSFLSLMSCRVGTNKRKFCLSWFCDFLLVHIPAVHVAKATEWQLQIFDRRAKASISWSLLGPNLLITVLIFMKLSVEMHVSSLKLFQYSGELILPPFASGSVIPVVATNKSFCYWSSYERAIPKLATTVEVRETENWRKKNFEMSQSWYQRQKVVKAWAIIEKFSLPSNKSFAKLVFWGLYDLFLTLGRKHTNWRSLGLVWTILESWEISLVSSVFGCSSSVFAQFCIFLSLRSHC